MRSIRRPFTFAVSQHRDAGGDIHGRRRRGQESHRQATLEVIRLGDNGEERLTFVDAYSSHPPWRTP